MNNSYELLVALKNVGYLQNEREALWWPNSGTFEVIIGAILTQQTKWEKVEKSLENLRQKDLLNLDALASIDSKELAIYIKPSGFYNTKAKNVKSLCKNIKDEFSSYEEFCLHVNRDWLLAQKGIGPESADSILCYGCLQEAMVVDSYSQRLLDAFGYEFESYDVLQEWFISGIESNFEKVQELYGKEIALNEVYARFHGKIVEFCKQNMRGKKVDLEELRA